MKIYHVNKKAAASPSTSSMELARLEKTNEEKLTYHKISFDELKAKYDTSLEDGLDFKRAQQILATNGKNIIRSPHPNVILKLFGYLFTGFCPLIWIGAIICIIAWKPLGNPPDPSNLALGILLLIVIFLQALFSAFQDWSSGRVMKTIKRMMPSQTTVIRNGIEHKITVEDLVVGDLVCLTYGTKVPADVRITESNELMFDRSMLTGESEPVEGTVDCTDENYFESKNMAFMATLITNGQGKGVVIATGDQTVMGSIAGLTNRTIETKTSLHIELQRFVLIVASVAVITAAIVLLVWIFWLRVKYPNYMDASTIMVNTIAVLVAFIPEGLPVCVTLSLLVIAKRMAKSRVLVKNLATIETLSCVNVIASDKTGTLTQNKMFVGSACAGINVLNIENLAKTDYAGDSLATKQLLAVSALCNNAHFDRDDQNCPNTDLRRANGDATDIALLRFSHKYSLHKNTSEMYKEIFQIPFNSKNKWMMKMVIPTDESLHESIFSKKNTRMMFLKGAPDILLKKCSSIIQADGTNANLDTEKVAKLISIQNDWCTLGQRVIILCKKELDNDDQSGSDAASFLSSAELEDYVNKTNDFQIVGMLGIIDPPREGIYDVVSKCRSAGIRVFMVTGDYALTAAAIATQVGIFTNTQYDTLSKMQLIMKSNENLTAREKYLQNQPTSLLLSGNDLKNLSKKEWKFITSYEEIVFSRTTPEQKLLIVNEFQGVGYIVGVTGDGVNDAPALKSADIGIAMGGGSDVAMEAAQLVLLDNNFSSILIAIENGRLVFSNLRKVILYLLPGGCMAELIPILLTILVGVPQNLSSFQMIAISLFTDIAPSLSLMMEKPEVNLLNRPPRTTKDHIVDWKFLIHAYLFLGVLISASSQFLFFTYMYLYAGFKPAELIFDFGNWKDGYKGLSQDQLDTFLQTGQSVTFVSLVLMQIFGNVLSTRTSVKSFFQRPPWSKATRNLWVFAAEITSIIILAGFIYIPFCNKVFYTRPIPYEFYLYPLVFSVLIFMADEIRKLFVRRKLFYFHKFGW